MKTAICKQIHPPTGVTHCTAAYLQRPRGQQRSSEVESTAAPPNLVVAKATLLEVYGVRGSSSGSSTVHPHLELLSTSPLWGVVESLTTLVSREGSGGQDAVLVTFRDAKLVVLEWDNDRERLRSSSLHYFEGDAALRGGRTVFPYGPRAVADPLGRCAVVLMFRHQLAVLPAMAVGATLGDGLEELLKDVDEKEVMHPGQNGSRIVPTSSTAASQPAASLGNSYVINLATLGIREVRDAVFLHGYNEPTLLLLHETDPTCPGYYCYRKDTCALSVLSMNISQRRQPSIWGASGLPSDAYQVSAAPRGGALVLCHNLLLYHTQGASCAVALNAMAFPGKIPPPVDYQEMLEPPSKSAARHAEQWCNNVRPETVAAAATDVPQAEGIDAEIDAANVTWLSGGTALLSLKTGELLVAALQLEGGLVRRIKVTKASRGPMTSCMATLGDELLFLGSWTADSLLLQSTVQAPKVVKKSTGDSEEDIYGEPPTESPTEEQATKRQRIDTVDPSAAAVEMGDRLSDDDEAAAIYAMADRESAAVAAMTKQSFRMVDRLSCVAAIADMAVGDAPPCLGNASAVLGPQQLVAAVGQDRSGALAVLRRGIVPDAITDPIPLHGVTGMWALYDAASKGSRDLHTNLVVSTADGTRVLEDSKALSGEGEDLAEVSDMVALTVSCRTLAAGNVLSRTHMVQVCPTEIRLLCGVRTLVQALHLPDILPADTDFEGLVIVAADVLDPYVLLRFDDGTALLLSTNPVTAKLEVVVAATEPLTVLPATDFPQIISACSLSSDTSGWLAAHVTVHSPALGASLHSGILTDSAGAGAPLSAAVKSTSEVVEGSSGKESRDLPSASTAGTSQEGGCPTGSGADMGDGSGGMPGHSPALKLQYLLIARANGGIQICQLPSMEIIFSCSNFAEGAAVLEHDIFGSEAAEVNGPQPDVLEIRLESFGPPATGPGAGIPAAERPHLVALLSDTTMLLYKAAAVPVTSQLRFIRSTLDLVLHGESAQPAASNGEPAYISSHITRFDGLNGHMGPASSGIFICGTRPLWLMAARGCLVPYPMEVHAAVSAFTPFNSSDCPQGFITAGAGIRGSVNICTLAPGVALGGPWPLQKLPQGGSPNKIAYYPEARLYALLVSRMVPYKAWLPQEHPGEPTAAAAYATAEGAAKERGSNMCAELRLVAPGSWRTVARHQLQPQEVAMCVRHVHLTSSRSKATQPLIAVGTSFSAGEDYPCSGRLLLFEITKETVAGQTQAENEKWKVSMLYVREFAGPVTGISALDGLLLLAAGNRLEAHSWDGARLARCAFFNAPFFVTSLKVVKSFILLGDVHSGVIFVRYHENQLTQLSKDFDAVDVTAAEFLISGGLLLMLAADAGGTLRLFSYDQKSPASARGSRLLPLGAFHMGTLATSFVRYRLATTDGVLRQAAVCGTTDGSLVAVATLWDTATYDVLYKVQMAMALELEHTGGLNPVAYRRRHGKVPAALGGGRHFGKPIKSSVIIDGDLIWQYTTLARTRQAAVAAAAGTTSSNVLLQIKGLASAMTLF